MKSILVAGSALAMLCAPAFAQTSNSNSGSNATVNTASGSQSQSVSNPKVNVIGNPIGNGASSSNSGAKATSNTRSSSRSAAVGNTTNVTVSGYSRVDSSGNSTGSGSTKSAGTTGSRRSVNRHHRRRLQRQLHRTEHTGGHSSKRGGRQSVRGRRLWWPFVAGLRRRIGRHMGRQGVRTSATGGPDVQHGRTKVGTKLMCQDEHVHQAMVSSGKPCTATFRRHRGASTGCGDDGRHGTCTRSPGLARGRVCPSRTKT